MAHLSIVAYPRRAAGPRVELVPRSPEPRLENVAGFLVADVRCRVVGRVTGPMYGASSKTADALSVRFGVFPWRRRLVPAAEISEIDRGTRIIGLRVDRETIRAFL
jgi:hypothetical protein